MEDRVYFLKRAELQVELARQAACEKAAQAHYQLAGHYWDRAYNPGTETRRRASSWANLLYRRPTGT